MQSTSKAPFNWRDRVAASAAHLILSLVVAALAAGLVFGLWYPYPYRELSGGRELFLLVVAVDVILGPLITLAIFNKAKGWPVLRRDLAVVVVIQLIALSYGLWTVFVARPVHLVFEYSRFRVVHAIDVPAEFLEEAVPELRNLPLTGPTLLSLRPFKDNNEQIETTLAAANGLAQAARPQLWQSYSAGKAEILQEAKPLAKLIERFPAQTAMINEAVRSTGRATADLAYLPLAGRKVFWTVLIDAKTAQPLAFFPLDPF